ncbi:MAG: hypothetical protein ACYST6_00970 [Planctomycetota bacterium]|jgi:hypothetical protein
MRTRLFILVFLMLAAATLSGYGAEPEPKYLLADGFALGKVEGRLAGPDSNEGSANGWSGWFFELGSDVSDGRGSVKAGEKLELLPSATLEKMTTDATRRSGADYQLRGRVTRYKGENFIFPTGFAPLSTAGRQETPQPQSPPADAASEQQNNSQAPAKEPNDVVTIPQEVMDKLQPAKLIGRTAVEGSPASGFDAGWGYLIAERTGSFTNLGEQSTGAGRKAAFVVDGLGRNLPEARFELLPCETLERAEREQSASLEQLRFKIAAIATTYRGRGYLLLQKAGRAYGYGNFPK